MERYRAGVVKAAGSMKLTHDVLNHHIIPKEKIVQGDTVNMYINFECVLKNLIDHKDRNAPMVTFFKQSFVLELESGILDLIGFYRIYWKVRKCHPRIFLYYTDISDDSPQQMEVYNKFYRSYYRNMYGHNPEFKQIGEVVKDIVIPQLNMILQYVPNCYLIQTKLFDGSLIPMVLSNQFPESKHVVLSSDVFDTLYMLKPEFLTLYAKRRFPRIEKVISTIEDAVGSIIKGESPFDLHLFNSPLYYKLLLSIKGSRIRNIKSAKGFGYARFLKALQDGISKSDVLQEFESIDSIINVFPEKYREDIKTAFQCTDLDVQYGLLSKSDVEHVISQIVDKSDPTSLEALNNKRFLDFPINLQQLLE